MLPVSVSDSERFEALKRCPAKDRYIQFHMFYCKHILPRWEDSAQAERVSFAQSAIFSLAMQFAQSLETNFHIGKDPPFNLIRQATKKS